MVFSNLFSLKLFILILSKINIRKNQVKQKFNIKVAKGIDNKLNTVNEINNNNEDYKREEIIRVFEYIESEEDFRELEIDENVPLYSLLGSDFILLFFSPAHKRVFHWIGKKTTPKMKGGAANRVIIVRDIEAHGYLIRTEDEGEESISFKIMIGLVEQEEEEKH